jgi:hypothetical protein
LDWGKFLKKAMKILVKIVVAFTVLVSVGLGIKALYVRHYESQKKPFWKGTEHVQVCKMPYYSSDDCFRAIVTILDETNVRIHLPNGSYKDTSDLTCYFAARAFAKEPRYVFCRSWDSDDNQWDLLPVWVYHPSLEDVSREIKKYSY